MPGVPASPGRRVVHYRRTLFETTETFIYTLIRSQVRYDPVVVCQSTTDPRLGHLPSVTQLHASGHGALLGIRALKALTWPFPQLEERRRQAYNRRAAAWPQPRMVQLLRALAPAVVHAHFLTDVEDVLSAACEVGVPLVVNAYGVDVAAYPRNPLARARVQSTFADVDCVVALTTDMRDDLLALGCPESKIRIAAQGVPTSNVVAAEHHGLVVLAAARFLEKKGMTYLIEAARRIASLRDDVVFEIVGEGPLADELVSQAGELAGVRIRFLGGMDYEAFRQHLAEVDLVAVPSVTALNGDKEGLPTVILDAMAAGLPVVGTRHAGIPDALIDGETGLLVEERDVDGLLVALQKLLDDADLRRWMGSCGRARFDELFRADAYARRIEAVYDEVVDMSTRRSAG
ncbi:MAG: glycosyltransferase [Coriobacteriia bacterium]|nr:glycosyltransferase [Coriobacteriia bacterium]